MPSLLFVCTANICRSPMAMALFRTKILPEGDHWRIESAGTWAQEDYPASLKAQEVVTKLGGELSDHRSQAINKELLDSFNLILTMEQGHKEALQAEFPGVRKKVYLLSEMAGPGRDIKDPYGSTLEDYEATAEEIATYLTEGLEKICELAAD